MRPRVADLLAQRRSRLWRQKIDRLQRQPLPSVVSQLAVVLRPKIEQTFQIDEGEAPAFLGTRFLGSILSKPSYGYKQPASLWRLTCTLMRGGRVPRGSGRAMMFVPPSFPGGATQDT
jgi:hypothetical protein